jgi:hypothetical protein
LLSSSRYGYITGGCQHRLSPAAVMDFPQYPPAQKGSIPASLRLAPDYVIVQIVCFF